MGTRWRAAYAEAARRVETTLERGHGAFISFRAARRRIDRAYLRGRACHCPEGLPLHLLHSQGLREGCDVVIDFGANMENRERRQVPLERVAAAAPEFRRGDRIHVKADLLDRFVELVLPRVTQRVVLITGDSDVSPVGRFRFLLDHPRIAHWFAQNCDVGEIHPRLTRLPIGFDNPVYTRLDKRLGFLITMATGRTPFDARVRLNDMGNQSVLQEVRARPQRPVEDKPLEVLCCFLHTKHGSDLCEVADRREAAEILSGRPFARFPGSRMKQLEYWRAHARFAFEASPRGSGLDCFRTWEALFLDTIPIVRTSPLDVLYRSEGFPVVIVDSWAEITEDALARWRSELAGRFTEEMRRRLTNDHWLSRIGAAQAAAREDGA